MSIPINSPFRAVSNAEAGGIEGTGPRPSSIHLPTLDGVRGLAIVAVMLLHSLEHAQAVTTLDKAVWRLLATGWTGVDLFFVLSGFLITGILVDARGRDGYYRNFYVRRTLRIQPLYFLTVAVALFLLPAVGLVRAPEQARLDAYQPWLWTMLPNWLVARDGFEATEPLGHLWSVALEEQFYLVWPFVVATLGRERMRGLAIGLILATPVLRTALVLADTPGLTLYALPFTRADSLAWGALLAMTVRGDADLAAFGRRLGWVAAASLAYLVAIFVPNRSITWNMPSIQTLGYSALGACAAWVLWRALRAPAGSVVERVFGGAVLRFFGRYSYSLYLFHQLVMRAFDDLGFRPAALPGAGRGMLLPLVAFTAVTVGATCLLSMATWRLVEEPLLRLKRYFPA